MIFPMILKAFNNIPIFSNFFPDDYELTSTMLMGMCFVHTSKALINSTRVCSFFNEALVLK